jgi:hypothetical protein
MYRSIYNLASRVWEVSRLKNNLGFWFLSLDNTIKTSKSPRVCLKALKIFKKNNKNFSLKMYGRPIKVALVSV